jgi:thiamine-phosphate pyrophosphorylase
MYGLYTVTNGNTGATLHANVKKILTENIGVLQYRDKSTNTQQRDHDAHKLRQLCAQYNTHFIINDDIELTKRSLADGVHLGNNDSSIHEARHALGEKAIIGISCYNDLALAIKAEQEGASYVAFGSFFDSPTKPNAPKASIELLQQAKKTLSIPICCIGGITLANAPLLIKTGADMIAVISAVFSQPDSQYAARQFSALFDNENH